MHSEIFHQWRIQSNQIFSSLYYLQSASTTVYSVHYKLFPPHVSIEFKINMCYTREYSYKISNCYIIGYILCRVLYSKSIISIAILIIRRLDLNVGKNLLLRNVTITTPTFIGKPITTVRIAF